MRRIIHIGLGLSIPLLWFGTGGAVAQLNLDSLSQVAIADLGGTPLTLDEAVIHAVENSTILKQAEAAYLAAQGAVRRESGTFDPDLILGYAHLDTEIPTASFFAGAPVLTDEVTNAEALLRWDLPIGTTIDAGLSTIELNTNSQFANLNPQYTALGSLSLRQPLLGGFAATASRDLSEARERLAAQKSRYDQALIATRAEVERSYWFLYSAIRDYVVQWVIRNQGEIFVRETEAKEAAGLIGPNQVASARTFLAEQTLGLIDFEEAIGRLTDNLASQTGVRPGSGESRFYTVDRPPTSFPTPPADDLVAVAMESSLALKAAESDLEALRVLLNAARWEVWPSLDVFGSLGGTGLTGNPQDIVFGADTFRTNVTGSYGDAVSQAVKREFPNWSVGLELNIPIGLRSDLGERDRLEAEVMGAEQRVIELKRLIDEQVRAAHRALSNGQRRLDAAGDGVNAAKDQVRIGTIDFDNGRITAFELVRLGADFITAERRYTQAQVRAANAAVTMDELTSGKYMELYPR